MEASQQVGGGEMVVLVFCWSKPKHNPLEPTFLHNSSLTKLISYLATTKCLLIHVALLKSAVLPILNLATLKAMSVPLTLRASVNTFLIVLPSHPLVHESPAHSDGLWGVFRTLLLHTFTTPNIIPNSDSSCHRRYNPWGSK